MANLGKLGEEVKRYGYAKNKKIKLYGKELELISDPVDGNDENIFVDAEKKGLTMSDKCRFHETSWKWQKVADEAKVNERNRLLLNIAISLIFTAW